MLFGLDNSSIEELKAVIAQHSKVEIVLIYGSKIKGSNKHNSDFDITIKGGTLDPEALEELKADIDELHLPFSFDIGIYDDIEDEELLAHIGRFGWVFFRKK